MKTKNTIKTIISQISIRYLILWFGSHVLISLILLSMFNSLLMNFLLFSIYWIAILDISYYLYARFITPSVKTSRFHSSYDWFHSSLFITISLSLFILFQKRMLPESKLFIENQIAVLVGKEKWFFPLLTGIIIFIGVFLLVSLILVLFNRFRFGKKDIVRRKFKNISFYISIVCLLTVVFSTFIFIEEAGEKATIYWGGTETYYTYRISESPYNFIEDMQKFKGFIYERDSNGEISVYSSNTGFYGSVLKLISEVVPKSDINYKIRVTLSFLLSCVLVTFIYFVRKKFSIIAVLPFILLTCFNFWIVGPSKHIIWIYFLLFIPFLFAFIQYPRMLEGKISFKSYLTGQTIIFITTYLRGYEYISNITLSAMIPLIYFSIVNHLSVRKAIKQAGLIFAGSMIAFLFVLSIHIFQLSLYYGSISEGISFLFAKSAYRIAGESVLNNIWSVFHLWLYKVKVFHFGIFESYLNKFWIDFFKSINNFSIYFSAFAALLIPTGLIYYFKNKNSKSDSKVFHLEFAAGVTTFAALLFSWSWFPALHHMWDHPHMNGIIYIIPFGLCFHMFIGIFLNGLLKLAYKNK